MKSKKVMAETMTIETFYQQYKEHCCILNLDGNDMLGENNAGLNLVAKNKSHIIKVDGGIFPKNQEDKRVDYMAYTAKNLYIIELKGKTGIKSAYKQILSTIDIILHNDDFNFLICNRDKTMACIAGPVRYPRGGSREEKKLAYTLVKHSKEKPEKYTDLIIYSYKTKHTLVLE